MLAILFIPGWIMMRRHLKRSDSVDVRVKSFLWTFFKPFMITIGLLTILLVAAFLVSQK